MFEEREIVMIRNKIRDSGNKETACGDGALTPGCVNPVKTKDQGGIWNETTDK